MSHNCGESVIGHIPPTDTSMPTWRSTQAGHCGGLENNTWPVLAVNSLFLTWLPTGDVQEQLQLHIRTLPKQNLYLPQHTCSAPCSCLPSAPIQQMPSMQQRWYISDDANSELASHKDFIPAATTSSEAPTGPAEQVIQLLNSHN